MPTSPTWGGHTEDARPLWAFRLWAAPDARSPGPPGAVCSGRVGTRKAHRIMKLIQWVFLVVIAAIFNRELEALAVPPAHSYPSASSKFMPEFEKEFRKLQEHVEQLDEKHRKLNKKNG